MKETQTPAPAQTQTRRHKDAETPRRTVVLGSQSSGLTGGVRLHSRLSLGRSSQARLQTYVISNPSSASAFLASWKGFQLELFLCLFFSCRQITRSFGCSKADHRNRYNIKHVSIYIYISRCIWVRTRRRALRALRGLVVEGCRGVQDKWNCSCKLERDRDRD